jgi:serine/threonine-protein kinase HipA
MALTLGGSTNWPNRKALTVLGQTRSDLTSQAVKRIFEEVADALSTITPDMKAHFKTNAKHREIGDRLLAAWGTGVRESLSATQG